MLSWDSGSQIQMAKPISQHYHGFVGLLTLRLCGPQCFYVNNLESPQCLTLFSTIKDPKHLIDIKAISDKMSARMFEGIMVPN